MMRWPFEIDVALGVFLRGGGLQGITSLVGGGKNVASNGVATNIQFIF